MSIKHAWHKFWLEAIRSKEGIPLLQAVVDDLLDISRKTGIPFKLK